MGRLSFMACRTSGCMVLSRPTRCQLVFEQVLLALRQLLQLDAPTAGRFVAAVPIDLAVGLGEEMAERLRATLVGAGAVVDVQVPPQEPRPAAPKPPKPEPVRSMAEIASQIRWPAARRGPRILTGLALGRGGSYLAYGRAEGSRRSPRFPRSAQSPPTSSGHLNAGCRFGPKTGAAKACPAVTTPCGFDIVPTLSTRHQWFPCGPLLVSHLTWFFPGLFLLCSRPWLLTKAAEGGLEPAPASRFRGACPHRSSS
jgi:hypothetical protein